MTPVFSIANYRILFYFIGKRTKSGSPVKNVTVFQVDYVRKTKVPIGMVIERRTKDRGDNILGLLRLARKAYASSPEEALNIAIDARSAWAS